MAYGFYGTKVLLIIGTYNSGFTPQTARYCQ